MKQLLPDPTWSAVPVIVGTLIFVVLFLYNDPLLLLGGNTIDGNGHKAQILTIPQGVTVLISELRLAASDIEINDEEETKKWEEQHPCRSRDKLNLLYQQKKHGEILMKNPNWERVYQEYSSLHSRCMRKVGNVSQYFHSQNNSISDCKFVVPALYYGLGNKVLWFTSCLLYAILTKRVLLIPASTAIPDIMCEPFTGSSWRLEDDHSLINSQIWTRQRQVVEAMDQAWLFFRGCLYFLPGLFATRPFKPILESLFPDKMALTHMLRTVMLPADSVWQRIDRFHELFVTPLSTFGGLAQAYGALVPWFINFGKTEEGACVRGQSVDVCYQEGPVRYSCPFDEEKDHLISETVPYYQSCLPIDCRGVKLITSMIPVTHRA